MPPLTGLCTPVPSKVGCRFPFPSNLVEKVIAFDLKARSYSNYTPFLPPFLSPGSIPLSLPPFFPSPSLPPSLPPPSFFPSPPSLPPPSLLPFPLPPSLPPLPLSFPPSPPSLPICLTAFQTDRLFLFSGYFRRSW